MKQQEMGSSGSKTAVVVVSDLQFGGAQRQVVELCNHMDPARYQMHVCSLSSFIPLVESLRDYEKRFHPMIRKSRFDWTVVTRLTRLLRELKADVVHGYLFDAEIAGRLAARAAGIASIGSERNTGYTTKRLDYWVYKTTSWGVDLTIANSTAGADFNSRVFGLPRTAYRVVHNGVDSVRFAPRPDERLRAELGIPPGALVVGMFGSFKPQKNHSLLLRAAQKVVAQFPHVRFLFVGDELHKGMGGSVEFKQSIQRLVDELNLRSHCIFIGNRSDVERYYNVCDITALPSLFEGTPNVALESMASGVPVVATNVSDNSYVIPDGQAGFVVPLGDEAMLADRLCRLLGNQALREKLGRSAREWILKEFSGKRLAEKTADIYDEAVALRNGPK